MLDQVDEGLWAAAAPLSFYGLRIGTRMTVVRLPDGTLLIHSPIALDDALRAAVDALGPVAFIMAPNLFHHVHAGAWAAAYPAAQVLAPQGLRAKRPDLRIDAALDPSRPPQAFAGALVPHAIDGSLLAETVLVHLPTRTLISADVVENFDTSPHWLTRQYLKASGVHGRPGLPRPLRLVYRDRPAARRSIDALLTHDFNRVILAHGQIIERDGRAIVQQTFEGWLR